MVSLTEDDVLLLRLAVARERVNGDATGEPERATRLARVGDKLHEAIRQLAGEPAHV